MARSTPQHKQAAPSGYCWINEAAVRTGRSIETLYKDRKIQRKGGHLHGPRSTTINRNAAWRIADIDAWLASAKDLGPDADQLHNSRPAEPARAAA
ncbi:hypothetical protein OG785_45165 [Streptomyces sp. NBC_00006]|uniref:hypothetical protein n=1 Tax=Streptomyces sp. NBC_00006 TaxID=2975619 RepID=UPI0022573543|nr:hypothetical protein [Streptomyces sp. NBC_00006]MCX5529018.1 hypothetical protein [Streptomyces sp. NBC_00006]MCX5537750.1 hypothetical protein [Streptomyces sp. NBC_00006]